MTSRILGAVAILLSLPTAARPHQLDEYLQATRVVLGREGVALEIALTPGVAVAPGILALMDADGNRQISGPEARAYAQLLMKDLDVTIDGERRDLALSRFEFPSVPDMMDGMGIVRLELTVAGAAGAPGAHRLTYRNSHKPATPAYLVNALRPGSRDIEITGQQRDPLQRSFQLDYTVASGAARWSWLTIAALGLTMLAGYRRRERQGTPGPR